MYQNYFGRHWHEKRTRSRLGVATIFGHLSEQSIEIIHQIGRLSSCVNAESLDFQAQVCSFLGAARVDITPAAGCLSPSGKLWAGPPRRALPPATDSAVTHNQISGRLPTAPAAGLASAVIHNQNICQPNRGSWTARLQRFSHWLCALLRIQSTCYLNRSRTSALYFPEIWLLVNLCCEYCLSVAGLRSHHYGE